MKVGVVVPFFIVRQLDEVVPFGTWDGTRRNGTRRSVPRLVRLKRVECDVPREEFWVNFCSASPPGTTRSISVKHKIITSPSPSFSSLFPSKGIFNPSQFRPVMSRLVPSHFVSSCLVCIPNNTLGDMKLSCAYILVVCVSVQILGFGPLLPYAPKNLTQLKSLSAFHYTQPSRVVTIERIEKVEPFMLGIPPVAHQDRTVH
ncbi:hypothetical protein DVH24_019710 [Malus domestica]|uniref:Uncharacterized protein n=1 Tax=Malus domestica TaxID=3750 RepID=A0A498I3K7_MALDO|nr:hypothetical protein DVH24_019710 [Malus domestica]